MRRRLEALPAGAPLLAAGSDGSIPIDLSDSLGKRKDKVFGMAKTHQFEFRRPSRSEQIAEVVDTFETVK